MLPYLIVFSLYSFATISPLCFCKAIGTKRPVIFRHRAYFRRRIAYTIEDTGSLSCFVEMSRQDGCFFIDSIYALLCNGVSYRCRVSKFCEMIRRNLDD